MLCNQCQKEVPIGSAFCPQCGAKLTAGSAANDDAPSGAQRMAAAAGRGRGAVPAEDEIWTGGYSAKAMAGSFLGAAVLTALGAVVAVFVGPPAWLVFFLGAIVIWVGLVLLYLYRRLTVHYRLTTFRFFHDTGLLSRTGNRVEVIDIDDVTVHQGLIERMFGVGTIHISSSDKTHPDLSLPGIDDAKRVADLIDGTRRAERNRRGLHIESI